VADASGEQMDQAEMMRYLSEMIWFPAAFLAGNISFEAADDSSARVTLTDHGRSATGTLVLRQAGTGHRLRGPALPDPRRQQPGTWSTPITGYGEFEGLRLPARGKAIYKLPGGDLEYIDAALTGLHYDTGAAPPEGRAR